MVVRFGFFLLHLNRENQLSTPLHLSLFLSTVPPLIPELSFYAMVLWLVS